MENIKLLIKTKMGIEAITKRELIELGYEDFNLFNGGIELNGTLRDIAVLNLNLRTAERIVIKIAEFKATSFEELFNKTHAIDWDKIIPADGNFVVEGKSQKSKLFSISDCQRITEKAIITKLQKTYDINHFKKDGDRYRLEVALLKDIATITLDTSGDGLHKRGYREASHKAPISETLAAALVLLSFWDEDRILCDPFCGSGTIPIEAAMIAKNIAPGLMRKFDAEKFFFMNEEFFKEEKKKCYAKIDYNKKLEIYASDISPKAISIAKNNAEILGLEEDITFFEKDIRELDLPDEYGVIITNPPYGVRIGQDEVAEFAIELGKLFKMLPTWSLYAITADENFEKEFGKRCTRKRKLYNGPLKTDYYQYFGPKPKK